MPVIRVSLLWLLYLVLFIVTARLFIHSDLTVPPDEAAQRLPAMAVVALVHVLILVMLITRAAAHGWRLVLIVSLTFYGVTTFMAQIESLWFAQALALPFGMVGGIILQHGVTMMLFTPFAVRLLNKWNAGSSIKPEGLALRQTPVEMGWRLAVLAVTYIVLYFSFGYFVAWQNPDLRAIYSHPEGAWAFNNQILIPWQFLRGLMWVGISLPLLRVLQGNRWQVALMLALLLALPMNVYHLLPNPYMPLPSIRLSHFIETATSNFLFGLCIVWLLSWRPASHSD